MHAPSPLLLLWCGLAATIAAAITGAIAGGTDARSWSLAPHARSRAHALYWCLAGILAYPAVYGLIFEALHRADIRIGLLLGAIHAAIMFIAADPRRSSRNALRVAAAHLVYGAIIAFLYVTP